MELKVKKGKIGQDFLDGLNKKIKNFNYLDGIFQKLHKKGFLEQIGLLLQQVFTEQMAFVQLKVDLSNQSGQEAVIQNLFVFKESLKAILNSLRNLKSRKSLQVEDRGRLEGVGGPKSNPAFS